MQTRPRKLSSPSSSPFSSSSNLPPHVVHRSKLSLETDSSYFLITPCWKSYASSGRTKEREEIFSLPDSSRASPWEVVRSCPCFTICKLVLVSDRDGEEDDDDDDDD